MYSLLDYIEHASGVISPVFQIFRAAQFLYSLTRPAVSTVVTEVIVSDTSEEDGIRRQHAHTLQITANEVYGRTLERLDYLRADRDFLASQISIARQVEMNNTYSLVTRERAAITILELHTVIGKSVLRSIEEMQATPILRIDHLPVRRLSS
ncbi:MAG TPA: hypothetical protein VHP37_28095 [Burkholderiales bacterium]|nr:hypothetical protein [Burkholderiales bacterium]